MKILRQVEIFAIFMPLFFGQWIFLSVRKKMKSSKASRSFPGHARVSMPAWASYIIFIFFLSSFPSLSFSFILSCSCSTWRLSLSYKQVWCFYWTVGGSTVLKQRLEFSTASWPKQNLTWTKSKLMVIPRDIGNSHLTQTCSKVSQHILTGRGVIRLHSIIDFKFK